LGWLEWHSHGLPTSGIREELFGEKIEKYLKLKKKKSLKIFNYFIGVYQVKNRN
jgi:hypothetical protein